MFSGGKGGRCVRLTTLPLSCAVVMKSGNLNFLESSGPLQVLSLVRSKLVSLKFFIIRSHYGPGVDSVSNRIEYQERFLGVKRPVRKTDNLTTILCLVLKSGNLNFLEPSGPLHVCNGTALHLAFCILLFKS